MHLTINHYELYWNVDFHVRTPNVKLGSFCDASSSLTAIKGSREGATWRWSQSHSVRHLTLGVVWWSRCSCPEWTLHCPTPVRQTQAAGGRGWVEEEGGASPREGDHLSLPPVPCPETTWLAGGRAATLLGGTHRLHGVKHQAITFGLAQSWEDLLGRGRTKDRHHRRECKQEILQLPVHCASLGVTLPRLDNERQSEGDIRLQECWEADRGSLWPRRG